ncbi:MAG: heme ABC exporter ATP-binding protein CcmA [Parvibaculum sp.]|uniref:heme ABC exporter ATP-binding protein CcmA n=1 Tax=Parvibaculum sp. TaxID=2024848 RepID=UPI00271966C4|nr:heme ABC exporter ATP-binding protein CcmA [Parvibaculum sp.]MDO8837711.1 heme ABC exporter ATP-binding protein CcmA [Parvibaculum sp.]
MRLSASHLACERGGRLVFDGVSFTVGSGEALVLTGPNGSGKSSLLRQIAGLLESGPDSLRVEGGDPELTLAEQSHYVGHLDGLKPAMTVAETLHFWAAWFGTGAGAAHVAAALDGMNLASLADLPAAYLSAGQKRRLALARLLAAPRPVWLLDEPTVGLDTASIARLGHAMQAHLAGGGLIVAATHLDLGLATAKTLDLGTGVLS